MNLRTMTSPVSLVGVMEQADLSVGVMEQDDFTGRCIGMNLRTTSPLSLFGVTLDESPCW
jgi:hypothetical protein